MAADLAEPTLPLGIQSSGGRIRCRRTVRTSALLHLAISQKRYREYTLLMPLTLYCTHPAGFCTEEGGVALVRYFGESTRLRFPALFLLTAVMV